MSNTFGGQHDLKVIGIFPEFLLHSESWYDALCCWYILQEHCWHESKNISCNDVHILHSCQRLFSEVARSNVIQGNTAHTIVQPFTCIFCIYQILQPNTIVSVGLMRIHTLPSMLMHPKT